MSLNASAFIKKRKNQISLTQKRVKDILTCLINSYEQIITKKIIFDYNKRGTYKHEDYLTSCLVDDFLQYELQSLNSGTTEYSIANTETKEKYIGIDNEFHPDPIDIQIVDSALKSFVGVDDKIYFAIECKRLTTSSVSEYVKDTVKFSKRNYIKTRLPFEGQLGYVEKDLLSHQIISEKINQSLSSNSELQTLKQLENHLIKDNFSGSYLSEHLKSDNSIFSVFHLFFDYSKSILN